MRHITGPIVAALMAIVAANCSLHNTGCTPALSAQEMGAAYTAELLACTEKAGNVCADPQNCTDAEKPKALAYSRVCRHEVNRKYGLCNEPWPAVTPCED